MTIGSMFKELEEGLNMVDVDMKDIKMTHI